MKTFIEQESYAIQYQTTYGEELCITWTELREAKIGQTWQITDTDCYPNANYEYTVKYEVVYKNDDGVAILVVEDDPNYKDEKLVWFDFAK